MIVFDLEWNSGYDRILLDEILQIGAVKQAEGRITDSFCVYVKPSVHAKIRKPADKLPELRLSLDSGVPFPEAAAAFADWCAGETEFATWGREDFRTLKRNLDYWKLSMDMPETYCDLQTAFSRALHSGNAVSLERAAAYCNIPDSFTFHNALYDAMYSALIGVMLPDRAMKAAICPVKGKEKPVDDPWRRPVKGSKGGKGRRQEPALEQYEYGLCTSPEQALRSRACRRTHCPVCGAVQCICQWRSADDVRYYAKFSCPEHGTFLLQLELRQKKNGCQARLSILAPTDRSRALFRAAGKVRRIDCGALPRRRSRRKGAPRPAQ
ncbi:MAG: exonuclease domain-containing protein [Oscillospiraceae bacterium]|nr:exonuclease domain-containing protein [Oscillospiraceae bacterium]